MGHSRLNRRRFLRAVGGVCGAWGALRVPTAAAADTARRTLRFVHTHTGESLTATYFDGADYDAASLQQINYLLRDFRNDEVRPIDPALLDVLHAAQVLAGHDAPFQIISAYRSAATNAMLREHSGGVAEHSQHLLGKAIDVRLSGLPTRELQQIGLRLARGGVGYYPASDFVHLDTGPVRHW
jgi:uncharacterized protein YcbK (DUF882 family)